MDVEKLSDEDDMDEVMAYANYLMARGDMSILDIQQTLEDKGLSGQGASYVVSNLENGASSAKKTEAQKDMIFGALWCIGGTVATIMDIGYIFWGAIVFGGFQFFRGLMNANG